MYRSVGMQSSGQCKADFFDIYHPAGRAERFGNTVKIDTTPHRFGLYDGLMAGILTRASSPSAALRMKSTSRSRIDRRRLNWRPPNPTHPMHPKTTNYQAESTPNGGLGLGSLLDRPSTPMIPACRALDSLQEGGPSRRSRHTLNWTAAASCTSTGRTGLYVLSGAPTPALSESGLSSAPAL